MFQLDTGYSGQTVLARLGLRRRHITSKEECQSVGGCFHFQGTNAIILIMKFFIIDFHSLYVVFQPRLRLATEVKERARED
jgi:hypothetical protein